MNFPLDFLTGGNQEQQENEKPVCSAVLQSVWQRVSNNYNFFLHLFHFSGVKTSFHVTGLREHEGDRQGHGPEPRQHCFS